MLTGCAVTQAAIDPNSERSVTRSFRDITAARAIKSRMLRIEGFDLNDISVDVDQGIVVLAGAAPREEDKIEAERIAWSAPGVTQVGNEVRVGQSANLFSKTKDDLIATAIRTKLAGSNSVKNLNYTIEMRDGVAYLLGVARSEEELAEAARLASITRGVKEVVSYVTIKGDIPNSYYSHAEQSHIASRTISPSYQGSDDLSYWGEPVTSMPNTSSSETIPYSPPSNTSEPYTHLDPSAPLPYRPGISEINPDTMGPGQLDPDAIESGEPYYRDPVTGEQIIIPEGVKPIPYVPDMGPGSLGAGGTPPPPGANINPVIGVTHNSEYQGAETQIYLQPANADIIAPTNQPPTEQIQVYWNGSAWVAAE